LTGSIARLASDDLDPVDEANLRTNAWCGAPATSPRTEAYDAWGLTRIKRSPGYKLLSAKEVDDTMWEDPRVGWGVVLPDNDRDAKDKARALDAPECIRRLLAKRGKSFAAQGGAPVFRYRRELELGLLRRYTTDGKWSDPGLGGNRGVAPNAVPKYLLIVGSPKEIPWLVQYRLQLNAFVGRLDLDADGLDRYVEALLADWSGCKAQRSKPVVWAVDHGARDISHTMRRTIADRLADALRNDEDHDFDMAGGFLSDNDATGTALARAIGDRHPAFVATTSHGITDPPDDPTAMAAQLGLLLDADAQPFDSSTVIASESIAGTIWYAHACCSAGCNDASAFAGIAPADSRLGKTLAGLERVGASTAPLPRRLLGGPAPARAFVGHIEPTFEWTLRDPRNGQVMTASIIGAMYERLHLRSSPPIGYALSEYWRQAGGLWREYIDAKDDMDDRVTGAVERVKRSKLVASDHEAMVLLGDPTVRCK
jgi:hypothetical protein